MPALSSAAMCSRRSRRARMPPWIFGWSVLTRPSSISGKPVCADTSVTRTPSFSSSLAVPPVETICTPSAARARANSTTPDLSETLMSARETFTFRVSLPMSSRLDPQLLDFLAQGIAIDAEHCRRGALVARGLAQHRLDQWPFDVLEHHVVDRGGLLAVHVAEIALQGTLHRVGELGVAAHAASCARASKNLPSAASCAAAFRISFASRRKASPPGRPRTYQPMCLRAIRTPCSSPYNA